MHFVGCLRRIRDFHPLEHAHAGRTKKFRMTDFDVMRNVGWLFFLTADLVAIRIINID